MDRAIQRDFKRYEKRGISKESLEETWKACQRHKEFLRYQVIENIVYGPQSRMKTLLEEVAKRYKVPDVDFIYYYEDRLKPTFFKRRQHRNSAPLFVSAKDRSMQHVILFADWNFDVLNEESGWNGLIRKVNEAYRSIPWSEKIGRLFWRGTPWDGKHFGMYTFENWKTIPRGILVSKSKKMPEFIDAKFSEYPSNCVEEDPIRCEKEMGRIVFIPWEEVFRHKYHMIVDGVTCTFPATQWKLLSGSLCFKQDSPDMQYYYDELKPWVHYVPVKRDLSDIKEKILWAKEHDDEALQIAENGRNFVLTHLMKEDILLYCYKALCKYAFLQRFIPLRELQK